MKKNNSTSFIIIAGVFILCIFAAVSVINILPKNRESDSYYAKPNDNMTAKIESLNVNDDTLEIITSGNASHYCIKTTKTMPGVGSMCWEEIKDNRAVTSIYKHKEYYVWIKDTEGNISNPSSISPSK